MTFAAYRMSMHSAIGFLRVVPAPDLPPPSCWIIFVTAILSCCLITYNSPSEWYCVM